MLLDSLEILHRLGAGESLELVAAAADLSRDELLEWFQAEAARRVPDLTQELAAQVGAEVRIDRDELGIPTIRAASDADLFFGFGLAMAQDRLFQLDYLRRKAHGRLAEILGSAGLENDLLSRTIGLSRIAAAEWERLDAETRSLVEAFSAGINAWIEQSREIVPIEFDLLDYRPEPWSPVDCLAIESEFRWYLTGRFPVLCIPELAKRTLGEGVLYQDFLLGEADDETIVPPEFYPSNASGAESVGQATGDPDASTGSNNWVVSGAWSASGKPLLAGDPHIAIDAVSCWYQVSLQGGSFHTAGICYVGMPGIVSGRNPHVAWAITNNICSLRDLYQEKTSAEHPNCFLYDGQWEPARELTETIAVKGAAPVAKTVRFSRNGPIVDELLPPPADQTGPVSIKWLGAFQGGWLTAMLQSSRAKDIASFRAALKPWHVPTFNLVFADVEGNIGMQSTGRVPIRNRAERGYRLGWDPADQWQGLVPFEDMPRMENPARGWIVTANNRVVTDEYPYKLHGCWSSGQRAVRIRQMLTAGNNYTRADFQRMQYDVLHLRAQDTLPSLLAVLRTRTDNRTRAVVDLLSTWDCKFTIDAAAPTIFTVFFTFWSETIARERFDEAAVPLMMKGAEPLACRLLADDPHGWFVGKDREAKIIAAMECTLDLLTMRYGPEMHDWTWSRVHQLPMPHVLGTIGELHVLLNQAGGPVRGEVGTVCNSGIGPNWSAPMGAGYRLIVDLASNPPELWAIDAPSQSGHVGSPDSTNQFNTWLAGELHPIRLANDESRSARSQRLVPS